MDHPSRSTRTLTAGPDPRVAVDPGRTLASGALFTPRFLELLAIQHVFGLSFSVYFLLPKYLAKEFAANASTIGTAGAAPLLTGVLASPLLGFAIDRYGRRALLLTGAVLGVLTSLGMAVVSAVGPALYVVRALQGVGFALVFNATAVMVADWAPASRLGQAMGLLGAASLVANAIGPGIAEPIAERWGFRSVFVGAAALAAITAGLAFRVENAPRTAPSDGARASSASGVVRLCAIAAVMGAAFGTLTTFTQPLALERGAERIAGFFFGYAAGALLVRIGLGAYVDRVGRMRVARVSLIGYGLITAGTALVQPSLLELFGFGFGISHGLLYPSLAALVVARSDPARHGRTLTAFNAAFNGGCSASLLGCGVLARSTGYPLVFVGVGALVLASVASLRLPAR